MTSLDLLRQRTAKGIMGLVWFSLLLLVGRAVYGMEANINVVIGGGLAIAATSTLTWWKSPIGVATRISTGLALAGQAALLVYAFSGSSLQIDVHMYFFASLAVTAMWIDWRPIVAFSGLTAVHHLALFFVLPVAVFPGNSDLVRVIMHAAILVLEAGALITLSSIVSKALVRNDESVTEIRAASGKAEEMAREAEIAQSDRNAESDRREIERTQDNEKLQTIISVLGEGLNRLANGDLSYRIAQSFEGKVDQLRADFNASMGAIEEMISAVNTTAGNMSQGADSVRSKSDDLSSRIRHQAVSLEETAAAIERITQNVKKASDKATDAGKVVAQAKADAGHSEGVVDEAVSAMTEIETSSKQISQIISVIDDIAFQTNLLALNAGVEAARAGDAGKGFAVVAQEVRELAQRSANAAKEIKTLIQTSSDQVNSGVSLVHKAGKVLRSIGEQVNSINTSIVSIVEAAREQAAEISEVNSAINEIDKATQQNAALIGDAAIGMEDVSQKADALVNRLGAFKTSHSAPGSHRAPNAAGVKADPVTASVNALKGTAGKMASPDHRGASVRAPVNAPARVASGGKVSEDGWEEF